VADARLRAVPAPLGAAFGVLAFGVLALACEREAPTAAPVADAGGRPDVATAVKPREPPPSTATKIRHVVMIIQENRSFDHYFGMFPGADGFTLDPSGKPINCNPDPNLDGGCVVSFHDPIDSNSGGPHSAVAFETCFADGKMDGFIKNAEIKKACADPVDPECTLGTFVDVMGYKTEDDIPNYWAYAKAYTLLDHLFQSDASWSWPTHEYLVSEWAALCKSLDPMSCTSNIGSSGPERSGFYSWTSLPYLLDKANVTWKYYLSQGEAPDCDDGEQDCPPVTQLSTVSSFFNPLPLFEDVKAANEESTNVTPIDTFYQDVAAGTLPAVAWIVPAGEVSEHPPSLVSEGQAYTTALINAIMQSPAWDDTVIVLFWDDWGGFYDHVPPLRVDANGYGFRTPGILISPWVKAKSIDKQVLSFDAIPKLIEDTFLEGQRLDPKTDGRPDSRPDVRENLVPGDLRYDFDFTQTPNPPLVLPPMHRRRPEGQ
jgi:phospholipase C